MSRNYSIIPVVNNVITSLSIMFNDSSKSFHEKHIIYVSISMEFAQT